MPFWFYFDRIGVYNPFTMYMRVLELPCSMLAPHCLTVHGFGSSLMFLGIKEPSSLYPIYFSVVVLWLTTSPSNIAFIILKLIVHLPLVPWSMLAWTCIGNDINHLQHSILILGCSTMFLHGSPLLIQLVDRVHLWYMGSTKIRWLSQACSELGKMGSTSG